MATDLAQKIDLNDITGLAPKLFTEPVDPARTALILVDMQGEPAKSMHVKELRIDDAATALKGCETLLQAARRNNIKVVHVILGSWTLDGSDLSDHKKRANRLYAAEGKDPVAMRHWDSPESKMFPSLEPIKGEILVRKTSASAFQTTGLHGLLQNMGIYYAVFAGQLADGCMGLTAINATDYGYAVTVADGACYGTSRAAELIILRFFDQQWGRVRTVDELVGEFEGGK